MTKVIARATNDKGQVVEIRGQGFPEELWINGVQRLKAGPGISPSAIVDDFYYACAVEKDHEH